MADRRRSLRSPIARAGAVALAAGLLAAAGCSRPKPAAGVAAEVNGKPILVSDIAPAVAKDVAKYERLGVAAVQPSLTGTLQQQRLQQKIDDELLFQAGQKLAIPDLDAQVQQKLDEAATGLHGGPSPALVDDPARRERIRRQVVVESYLRANQLVDVPVPEPVVEEYYAKHKQALVIAESRRVRHVLVKVAPGASPGDEAAARAKIDRIRKAVAAGREKLEDAARKHSYCKSAPLGGDLGDIQRGYMPGAFDQVAFSLPKGKLSEVVRTRHGFHVLEVVGTTPARVPELAEVHEFIAKYLQRGISQRAIAEHVAKLRSAAKVEVYLSSAKGT